MSTATPSAPIDGYQILQLLPISVSAQNAFCLIELTGGSRILVDSLGIRLIGLADFFDVSLATITEGARFIFENDTLSIECAQLSLSGPVRLVSGPSTTARFNLEMFAREANLILSEIS